MIHIMNRSATESADSSFEGGGRAIESAERGAKAKSEELVHGLRTELNETESAMAKEAESRHLEFQVDSTFTLSPSVYKSHSISSSS